jgi:hypothetical protein
VIQCFVTDQGPEIMSEKDKNWKQAENWSLMSDSLTSLDALTLLDLVLFTLNLSEKDLRLALHLSHEASLLRLIGVVRVVG